MFSLKLVVISPIWISISNKCMNYDNHVSNKKPSSDLDEELKKWFFYCSLTDPCLLNLYHCMRASSGIIRGLFGHGARLLFEIHKTIAIG